MSLLPELISAIEAACPNTKIDVLDKIIDEAEVIINAEHITVIPYNEYNKRYFKHMRYINEHTIADEIAMYDKALLLIERQMHYISMDMSEREMKRLYAEVTDKTVDLYKCHICQETNNARIFFCYNCNYNYCSVCEVRMYLMEFENNKLTHSLLFECAHCRTLIGNMLKCINSSAEDVEGIMLCVSDEEARFDMVHKWFIAMIEVFAKCGFYADQEREALLNETAECIKKAKQTAREDAATAELDSVQVAELDADSMLESSQDAELEE